MGGKHSTEAAQAPGEAGPGPDDAASGAVSELAEETKFNEEEVQALYDTFKVCASKSEPQDRISAEEMGEALEGAGMSAARQEVARRLFHAFDKDESGMVNLVEFVGGMATLTKGDVGEMAGLAFDVYDLDGSGGITKSEMSMLLGSMSRATGVSNMGEIQSFVKQLFAEFDADDSKKLSKEQFTAALRSHPSLAGFTV